MLLRGRIETTFGTLTTRFRRQTWHWEQKSAAAEDAISIPTCYRPRPVTTSGRPARSRSKPPQWLSQPEVPSTTQRRSKTAVPI